MKTYKIACIPGDGIGKEVIPAGELVLQALANKSKSFQFDHLKLIYRLVYFKVLDFIIQFFLIHLLVINFQIK